MTGPESVQIRHFHTKIAGVTHKNPDGTDRQQIIGGCSLFERLILDHEANNPHDPNAVRVCRRNGQQLGYLNAELAAEIAPKAKGGYRFGVFIKNITGGKHGGESFGVNLLIIEGEPGVSDRQVTKYAKQLMRDDPELQKAKIKTGCLGTLLGSAVAIGMLAVLYFFLVGPK